MTTTTTQTATLPENPVSNGTNLAPQKETVDHRTLVVCFEGEIHTPVKARFYMARSATGTSPVTCTVWVHGLEGTHAAGTGFTSRSSGGYCKKSTAFNAACHSAHIDLSEDVAGRGMYAVEEAMKAIAVAMGLGGYPMSVI